VRPSVDESVVIFNHEHILIRQLSRVYSRPPNVRVLLVEHEPAMVRVLERGLRAHGFEVTSAEPSAALATLASDTAIGMAVLDVPLTTSRGRMLLERVRHQHPALPLLLLTTANDPANTEAQLEKPFAMEELIARIHALTRAADQPRVTTLSAGDLRLDLLARCAWRGDRLIDLPAREFALLEYFMRHPRRVLSREQILQDVWGYHLKDSASTSNVVDVYVRYLRNRLQPVGEAKLIATVRGEGYQFNPPVEPAAPPSAAASKRRPPPRPRGRTTTAPLRPAK
jgi:DNA-binding response OmpR family regulator